jgi:hypothetical protein
MDNVIDKLSNLKFTDICVILAVIVVVLLVKAIKGIVKLIVIAAVIVVVIVKADIMSPEELMEAADVVKENGMAAITEVADASKSVKVANEDDKVNISVLINKEWVNIADIENFKAADDGKSATMEVNGREVEVKDTAVIKILNMANK